jgi:hypothetical protein
VEEGSESGFKWESTGGGEVGFVFKVRGFHGRKWVWILVNALNHLVLC